MVTADDLAPLARLTAILESRRDADPAISYTAALLADPSLAARKVGEEALEVVIASLEGDRGGLTSEAADLTYHLLVLMAANGLSIADIAAELARREGTSGHDEKAARSVAPE